MSVADGGMTMASGELRDKIAVVTGGASGIGACVSRAFAREGARVVILDRDEAGAKAQAVELPGAFALTVDVARSGEVDEAFRQIVIDLGRVDVVAHIAGVDDMAVKERIAASRAAGEPLDITATLSDDSWQRMISINLDGCFYVVRAATRVMSTQGSGSIITASSVAGVIGAAGQPHYSAAKAGVIGLTQAVAWEVADQGIRVNTIAPGPIETPMTARSLRTAGVPRSRMGRFGRPEEIAEIAVFLASERASFVTGTVVHADGGIRGL